MTGVPRPLDFLSSVAGFSEAESKSSADRPVRLAKVDPAYLAFANYPQPPPPARVTFEGETTLSTKAYGYVRGIVPWPGLRVYMIPVGNTYVIGGAINPQTPQGFWANANGLASGVEFGGGAYYDTDNGLSIPDDAAIGGDVDVLGWILHSSRDNRIPEIQMGVATLNGPGAGTSISLAVTFPVPWPAGTGVFGFAQITGAAGVTAWSMVRASTTNTQISLVILKTDAARANYVAGENFTVHWLALARPALP